MSLLYSRIFSCFNTVKTLFLLFSFISVESASKMAAIQVFVQFNQLMCHYADGSEKTDCHGTVLHDKFK